jgi:Putative Flp pilus-assembly TadE/G-like
MKANRVFYSRAAEYAARRRGMILVLATAAMIMILGFAAFSVDVGYIALTRAQLQVAADASAMAAAQDLPPGLTKGAYDYADEVAADGRATAVDISSRHKAGDRASIFCDGARDVRFGQVIWDPVSASWQKQWGVAPYNAVEVLLHRDQFAGDGTPSGSGDGPLPLFFAPVIGNQTAKLSVNAISAILPASGFHVVPGSDVNAGILPITLDDGTWDALIDDDWDTGEQDLFTYNDDGSVSEGGDGIPEANLYPNGVASTAAGNRGTIDFGGANNATSDLARQILHGVSDEDIAALGFDLNFDNGPLDINGDTGISAAIKAQLDQIIGQPRAIPIFSGVPTGTGNNAQYTIVKFVGIRIVEVKLSGNPKRLMIQPAPYVDPTATVDRTGTTVEDATFFTTATLIE